MVERFGRIEEARGSIPLTSTSSKPGTTQVPGFGVGRKGGAARRVVGRPPQRARLATSGVARPRSGVAD